MLQSTFRPKSFSKCKPGSKPPTYPVACLQSSKVNFWPNFSYSSDQLTKPGPSVSTISPSKSKTSAWRVIEAEKIRFKSFHPARRLKLSPQCRLKEFQIGKKPLQFDRRSLRAIGSMNHVEH